MGERADRQRGSGPTRCIAIGAALRWEVETLLSALRERGAVSRIDHDCWRGVAGTTAVVVYRTGVGIGRARRATIRVLHRTQAYVVVNTGCAGALGDAWRAGDLAAATAVVGPPPEHPRWVVAPRAGDLICDIAAYHLPRRRARLKPARIATSRLPIVTTAEKLACGQEADAEVVDMESAGVAAAAAANGCVFVGVRVILDPLRPDLPLYALPRRQRPAGRAAMRALSPGEILRIAALMRHQRAARASLRRFSTALFTALALGTIDRDLDGLRY